MQGKRRGEVRKGKGVVENGHGGIDRVFRVVGQTGARAIDKCNKQVEVAASGTLVLV